MRRLSMTLREEANKIINRALSDAMPGSAVRQALGQISFNKAGRIYLVAAGKAAHEMAKAAVDSCKEMGIKLSGGVVVTKYDHIKCPLEGIDQYEAGHPVPDENSYSSTQKAIDLVSNLTEKDNVLFLLSGGGSALFEKPLVSSETMEKVTKDLLACGASIQEMNTIRKRLSAVKGGKFALLCKPAKVFTIVLSDIIGDPLDMIASGPAYPDTSTCQMALDIVKRYNLPFSEEVMKLLKEETPKTLDNVETFVTGSVKQLCNSASDEAQKMGYTPIFLTASLCCEARDAGSFLSSIASDHQDSNKSLAFICGGETVVHLKGKGLGGRNQEIALSAAKGIVGYKNTCVFSVGSDGTDGPTDAAGGYCDGDTSENLKAKGLDIDAILNDNDAYNGLKAVDGLVVTGPTGTNVNDLTVLLIKR
ncbi:MAG: glycerate kinase [Sphaerochaetaceae bacterium]|nr:glycerate kinase [Sphaerochaetaceae bacterium]